MSLKTFKKQGILILLATFLIIIIASNVTGVTDADIRRGGVLYYVFDNNASNVNGTTINDWTNQSNDGTQSGISCGVDYCTFGASDYVTFTNVPLTWGSAMVWIYPKSPHTVNREILTKDNNGADFILYYGYGGSRNIGFYNGAGATSTNEAFVNNSFNNIMVTKDGATINFYSNNSNVTSDNTALAGAVNTGQISRTNLDTVVYGDYYVVALWNRTLNASEMAYLQNEFETDPSYNPWLQGGPPPPINYFTIILTDEDDSTSILNFSAVINGTAYNTTNGTINTSILNNASVFVDVNLSSDYSGGYFNYSLSYNVSSDLTTTLYQSEISITAKEKISNNTLTGTFRRNGTIINLSDNHFKAGNYNFSFGNSSYYNQSEIISIVALQNGTISITEIYQSLLNITVTNAYTGQNLTNFTGWLYLANYTYNETFNATYNNNSVAILELINGNYTVYVEHPHYSISTSTNYQNVTINNLTHNISFGLYSNNSIRITIYNEDTGILITDNISITITGNATEDTFHTVNGTFFKDNLTDGNYTVKFSGTNYTTKTYTVTVADRSTQTLIAYLSQNYQEVIFTIKNSLSGATIEGASFTMARLINATWTTTESKNTDITGRAQVNYLADIRYRFTITMTNYTSKIFYLDPIIFDSYDITIDPVLSATLTQDYAEVSIIYYPKRFYNNQTNNFTFIISNPTGALTSYSFNITYPGGAQNDSGSNAIGEQFQVSFNITGAGLYDKVNLTFSYDTTLAEEKTFNFQYEIIGSDIGNQTFIALSVQDYGLGIFEKILIATISVVVVAGFTFLVAGMGGALFMGIMVYALFVYLNFLPLWSILITALIGFVLIVNENKAY